MKQDLRRDFRYPIELDVDLFSHGHRIGRFKTRDIGPSGLFIETGPLSLCHGHPVQVAFSFSNRALEVVGVVVGRTTAGIGVRFAGDGRALFQALDHLLSIEDFSSARGGYRRYRSDSLTGRSCTDPVTVERRSMRSMETRDRLKGRY